MKKWTAAQELEFHADNYCALVRICQKLATAPDTEDPLMGAFRAGYKYAVEKLKTKKKRVPKGKK